MKKLILIPLSLLSLSVWGASCDELPIGESQKIQINRIKSKSNIEQRYTLKRVSEGQYEAFLNLEFRSDKKLVKEEREKVEGFRDKVVGCFEQFNQRLVDEKGRSLSLKLFDEKEHNVEEPP